MFQFIFCALLPEREYLNICAVTIQMCFHTMFFIQGLLCASWRDVIQADWQHFRKSIMFPIFIPLLITMQGFFIPSNHSLIGSIYLYPIYKDFQLNCLFIVGAWITLYTILWMIKAQVDDIFHPKVFKLTTESSLWCYISHSLFAFFFLTYFVVPFKNSMPFIVAFMITFVFTEAMCILSYFGLKKLESRIKRGNNEDLA